MTHPSPAEKPSELCPPLIDLYPDGRIPEAKGPIAECCGTVLMSDKRYEEVRSQLSRLAGELARVEGEAKAWREVCESVATLRTGPGGYHSYPITSLKLRAKHALTPTPPAKEQP